MNTEVDLKNKGKKSVRKKNHLRKTLHRHIVLARLKKILLSKKKIKLNVMGQPLKK